MRFSFKLNELRDEITKYILSTAQTTSQPYSLEEEAGDGETLYEYYECPSIILEKEKHGNSVFQTAYVLEISKEGVCKVFIPEEEGMDMDEEVNLSQLTLDELADIADHIYELENS